MRLFVLPSGLADRLPRSQYKVQALKTPFSQAFLLQFLTQFQSAVFVSDCEVEGALGIELYESFKKAVGTAATAFFPNIMRITTLDQMFLEVMQDFNLFGESCFLQIHSPGGKDWAIARIFPSVEGN